MTNGTRSGLGDSVTLRPLFTHGKDPVTIVQEAGWVPGQSARPRPTALLSPNSDGKPEAATAVVVAPDDGHEDGRNMLSCI
jgi:hypothetical protein